MTVQEGVQALRDGRGLVAINIDALSIVVDKTRIYVSGLEILSNDDDGLAALIKARAEQAADA